MANLSDSRIILQNVIFPSEDTCNESLMYYRDRGNTCIHNDGTRVYSGSKRVYSGNAGEDDISAGTDVGSTCIDNSNTRIYNGYFNIFSIHKWRHYTVMDKLFLHVEGRGEFTVKVFNECGRQCGIYEAKDGNGTALASESKNNTEAAVGSLVAGGISADNTADAAEDIYIIHDEKISHAEAAQRQRVDTNITVANIRISYHEDDRLLWFEFEGNGESAELTKAFYYTTDEPTQDVKLALDICTYKREPYVRRNMAVLNKSILQNPDSALFNKLDVYIIDNGQTLDKQELETRHIKIYPNKNAGGAGGFTRGIIEILKNKSSKGYTHMIFLDDDAVQEPDAFVRTAAIMALIKPEYDKASIAGCMLRLDKRYMLHEAGALWTDSALKQLHQGYDLRNADKVLENEAQYDIDYGAWFFACYPLSVINYANLPLPIFVHCDDSEYGLRNHNGVIVMNGICVWHDANGNGKSSSMAYYDQRNAMIISSLHDRDGGVIGVCKNLLRLCVSDCWRYRYKDAVLRCKAAEEFMKGPAYIGGLNPIAKNSELSKLGYVKVPLDTLTDDKKLLNKIRQAAEARNKIDDPYPRPVSLLNRVKYVCTFNGLILPARKTIAAADMNTQSGALYRVKDLILYDSGSMQGFRTSRSFSKAMSCLGLCFKTELKLLKKYRRVKALYKRDIHKLTNIEFWNGYLGL